MERNTVRTTFLGELPFDFAGEGDTIKPLARLGLARRADLSIYFRFELLNGGQAGNVDCPEEVSGRNFFRRRIPRIVPFIDVRES